MEPEPRPFDIDTVVSEVEERLAGYDGLSEVSVLGSDGAGCPWLCPTTAVNTGGVLSERRRRFAQVLADDEGGLRRETHRTAVGGDSSRDRQAAVAGAG